MKNIKKLIKIGYNFSIETFFSDVIYEKPVISQLIYVKDYGMLGI